jgi:Cu/Ag efflux protein CusF
MTKKAIALSAVLWIFLFCSLSAATEISSTTDPREKPKNRQVTGIVQDVDTKAKTVTVRKKVKDMASDTVAAYDDKTRILRGKEQKTIADIHVGDKVTMKYREADGQIRARSITIKSGG